MSTEFKVCQEREPNRPKNDHKYMQNSLDRKIWGVMNGTFFVVFPQIKLCSLYHRFVAAQKRKAVFFKLFIVKETQSVHSFKNKSTENRFNLFNKEKKRKQTF